MSHDFLNLDDRGRVLVADNDPIMTGVVRALLVKVGQRVNVASTSDEALRLVDSTRHRLVILDLDMPTEGGLSVCRSLKQRYGTSMPTIGILTAHDDPTTRATCHEAGAALFISKPFNPAELVSRLSPYLWIEKTQETGLAQVLLQDRGLQIQDQSVTRRR